MEKSSTLPGRELPVAGQRNLNVTGSSVSLAKPKALNPKHRRLVLAQNEIQCGPSVPTPLPSPPHPGVGVEYNQIATRWPGPRVQGYGYTCWSWWLYLYCVCLLCGFESIAPHLSYRQCTSIVESWTSRRAIGKVPRTRASPQIFPQSSA